MTSVLVVGAGLIGTSAGMALQATGSYRVLLSDSRETNVAAAAARGAGRAWDGSEPVDVALVAVPPTATSAVLLELQGRDLARTYTHVTSVQSQVQREVESSSKNPSAVVGGHPLAGKETSGPGSATSALFSGRPWAVCPGAASSQEAVADVVQLVQACGATPVLLDPQEHDRQVALASHLPQVFATVLASLLLPGSVSGTSAQQVTLSGPGLADTTRLAGSAADLWTEILTANAEHVGPALREAVDVLERLASQLASPGPDGLLTAEAQDAVRELLVRGNQGRALVPVKRGVGDEGFVSVEVEVDDKPGRLAALLVDAGTAGINVEDVRVDHVPGRPTGLIALHVAPAARQRLTTALAGRGWLVLD